MLQEDHWWVPPDHGSTLLIESSGRFVRDLVVKLTGHKMLADRGVPLIPVDCDQYFLEDPPTAFLIRQILGAVAQFERSPLGGQATRSPPAQAPGDRPLRGSELRAGSRSEARPGASRHRAAACARLTSATSYRLLASTTARAAWRRWCARHRARTDTAHTCHFRIVLPADTATVLAYMAHHNTAEQMRANIWRAVLIRIVTALVESRCQITPVDVTTLAETPVGQTFKTAFIPEMCDIHFASAADAATAKLFFADKVVGGP